MGARHASLKIYGSDRNVADASRNRQSKLAGHVGKRAYGNDPVSLMGPLWIVSEDKKER